MRDQVLKILGKISGADVENFEDLDVDLFESRILDSLGMVEMMVAIEKELGIQIQPTEVERAEIATPNKLIAFLENRKQPGFNS
ncbi:MAG: D-alanine--poly(phosphoribitol) ligase subunit 2 [Parachlamydiaceae bacterium]|nr:D-alanine--poly(phosphoribitol) ligase subunit 2 [Parachlamydiaceae bacterium]MBA3967027.1 D-alanine--poly(phosphoribitol) ligase subunit 2 [Nitrospirales bacterium]